MCVGHLKLKNKIIQTVPYSIMDQVTTVLYVADSTCRIRETAFHYMSSDPAQKEHIALPLNVRSGVVVIIYSDDYDINDDDVLFLIVFIIYSLISLFFCCLLLFFFHFFIVVFFVEDFVTLK